MIIISERINGLFRSVGKAIDKRDAGFIQKLAQEQVDAGAEVLDINTGPGVDDPADVMTWLVETVQDAVDVKLSIDTPKVDAMEAGIKVASGEAMINSTTAEEAKMNALFPLAKEYGTEIICLTLDEKGIPGDASSRCEHAMVLMAKAMEFDISPERVFLDPLILPIGAAQDQGRKVLEALSMFKAISDPPPKTVVGLSNISNNTRERSLINSTYIVMLMAYGLDAAIMDPTDQRLMEAIKTSDILLNNRLYCDDFLRA